MRTLTSAPPAALVVEDIHKRHGTGPGAVVALDGVSLSVPPVSFVAVMGPSGSGKSTLLHCAAGLDRPDSGRVVVDGRELTGDDETAITRFRRQRIGFVFQQHNLLPTLSVRENVLLPARLARRRLDPSVVDDTLRRVGLLDRADERSDRLSGGQQQRVAIARAVAAGPPIVLADEPTGALDTGNARRVLGLLREAVDGAGRTVVMVTHDPMAASFADVAVFLVDGRIVSGLQGPTADRVAEQLARLTAGVRPAEEAS